MYAVVESEFPQWKLPSVKLFATLENAQEYVKKVEAEWKEDLWEGDEITAYEDGSITLECAENCDPWYYYCQIVVVDEGGAE